ncbi:MAG TPA: hypothetical protein DIW47_06090 [Bacteroidetes bacterium]|nr:hypothetical protein [Bacteroidota bacterium]
MKNQEKRSKKYWPYYVGLPILILGLWTLSFWWTVYLDGYPEGGSERGDLFGGVNSLFSGLAFAGLIVTLLMQKEELSLQRDELILARQVAEDGLKEQRITNANAKKQIELTEREMRLKKQELYIQSYNNLIVHHSENHRFLRKEIGTETTVEQRDRNKVNAQNHLEKSNLFMKYLMGELDDLGLDLNEFNEIDNTRGK